MSRFDHEPCLLVGTPQWQLSGPPNAVVVADVDSEDPFAPSPYLILRDNAAMYYCAGRFSNADPRERVCAFGELRQVYGIAPPATPMSAMAARLRLLGAERRRLVYRLVAGAEMSPSIAAGYAGLSEPQREVFAGLIETNMPAKQAVAAARRLCVAA